MDPADATNFKVKPLWAKVDELYAEHIPEEQIKQFIDKQKKQIKASKLDELLDFVDSMRRMIPMGDLGISQSIIKDFLLQHASEINVNEVWKVLEKSGKQFKYSNDSKSKSRFIVATSNIRNALFILWCLLRSEFVIKRILEMIENKKIGFNVARDILTTYINNSELWGVISRSDYHGVIFQSDFVYIGWDSLYLLLRLVLKNTSYFKRKSLSRDYLISSFKNIYNSIPAELSKEPFELLLDGIKNTDQKIWKNKLDMSYGEIIDFVKKCYKYRNKNNNLSLTNISTDDIEAEDIKLLGVIFANTLFKRKLKRGIEEFFKKNPVSSYWQVRMMSLEYGDDYETVRNFIRDNINKFSYTDIFQHLLNAIHEDSISVTLYILLQLEGSNKVLSDIEKHFKKEKIKLRELKYLLRAYGALDFFLGVKPDKVFIEGLIRIINN